jgi:hypothetical protein
VTASWGRHRINLVPLIPLANGAGSAAPNPEPELSTLERVAASLARTFRTPCRIRHDSFDVSFSRDAGRNQYYSTAIIQKLERAADPDARVLGVTACDLYVPVLTFVFGEAQLDGNCAVVSTARLKEGFYGLPRRDVLQPCRGTSGRQRRGVLQGLPHLLQFAIPAEADAPEAGLADVGSGGEGGIELVVQQVVDGCLG